MCVFIGWMTCARTKISSLLFQRNEATPHFCSCNGTLQVKIPISSLLCLDLVICNAVPLVVPGQQSRHTLLYIFGRQCFAEALSSNHPMDA